MGFEAGAGHFFAAGVLGLHVLDWGAVGSFNGAFGYFEQVQHAEIFEEFRDAAVGIEQLDGAIDFVRLRRVQFQSEAGEDAEEGAVHEHAFGEIENETGIASLQELIEEGFEINAGREIGASGDLHQGGSFAD